MYLSVGDEARGITCPGFPITIEFFGTSKLINAPGAIRTLSPIWTFPIMMEFAFMQILFPSLGVPLCFPSEKPIRHPWLMLKLSPIIVDGWMTICPKCTIRKPLPICVEGGIWIPVLSIHCLNKENQKKRVNEFLAFCVFRRKKVYRNPAVNKKYLSCTKNFSQSLPTYLYKSSLMTKSI